jgi:NAD(P)-dependent dehydrogenase (short-subunit alcohol dehydrogenase family)
MTGAALYGSSKAALQLLTQAWAAEYGGSGVTANAIAPGPVRTPGTAGMGEALDQLGKTVPAGRVGMPAEIAAAAVFLASEGAGLRKRCDARRRWGTRRGVALTESARWSNG